MVETTDVSKNEGSHDALPLGVSRYIEQTKNGAVSAMLEVQAANCSEVNFPDPPAPVEVAWDGPNDTENPRNWPFPKKSE
jgi:hypothetical protein